MTLQALYCRLFQLGFAAGARLLLWRKPECLSGPGTLSQVPQLLASSGAAHPLLVASPRQAAAPAFCAMAARLPAYTLFSSVPADPTVDVVEEMVLLFRRTGCDSLVAVGGGSPIDAAKATAARLARPRRTLSRLRGVLKIRRPIVPLVAVPTTAGTGSETTIAAVITDQEHHKYAIEDLCLIPRFAMLDPELSLSLPPRITACTGMDAMTHAVEAYTNRLYNTHETRRLAQEAVQAIFRFLPRAFSDGSDLAARQALLTASYQAGFAFTRAGVGNVHALAHALGGLYGIPHGMACAVLLPPVLADYGSAVYPRLAQLARAAGLPSAGDEAAQARTFIAALRAMNRRFSLPDGFDCIREEDLPRLARWAEAEANPLYPVPVIYDQARFTHILRQVML